MIKKRVQLKFITNLVYSRYERNYKDGKLEGLYRKYYESGALWSEANYKDWYKPEGLYKVYYESGALKSEANYKDGNREGLEKWYYESGALESEVNYKDGKREGLAISYLENGRVFAELYYSNNNLINAKCANGRKWTNAEISNWEKGLKVSCGY